MSTACLFPGQGAQFVGMAKDLYDRYGFVKDLYSELNGELDFDLRRLSFEGTAEELAATDVCQPAIFAASLAALDVARERGLLPENPVGTAGLSLGEYTALCYSGAAPRSAVARVVSIRGRAMQACCEAEAGAMASLLCRDLPPIEAAISQMVGDGARISISNYNSPTQVVISGSVSDVEAASEKVKALGARVIPLKVAGAYHSPLMKPAVEALLPALASLPLSVPRHPFVMNASGEVESDPARIRQLLADQVCLPVQFVKATRSLQGLGMSQALELGPGTVLAGLLRGIDRSLKVVSLCSVESFDKSAPEPRAGG